MIRVVVAGVAGRMGREVARTLGATEDLLLVAAVDRREVGRSVADLVGAPAAPVPIAGELATAIHATQAEVLVDFTQPEAARPNAIAALEAGCAVVIGTSGLGASELDEIEAVAVRQRTPALVVPNFAIGAVLMMKFAAEAARWMPWAEVIELHHDGKLDAPSGTATRTAQLIAEARSVAPEMPAGTVVKFEGARGASVSGVPVHSVRLRGLVAHQEVLFGGDGETLSIRHDSLDRRSFMEGVKLCVRGVRQLTGLTVGMDALMQ
ncbi:MAG TPA: 4-hydroxy-tetrahydrodipicolinate reductase [Fimbriimonadaceae bacterium]|nr:4-hydroxy-tetrahydrodipicolinate reductase [Fimbriimonadaceae bacterium]